MAELVDQVAAQIAALPAPRNGQVRAVPDDRTVRYYATIGLLDRPAEMRGRTALYDRKHLAQVVAIKRLQTMGRSLAEIQALWPTLDDDTLARMSGVPFTREPSAAVRAPFWKAPAAVAQVGAVPLAARSSEGAAPVAAAPAAVEPSTPSMPALEIRVELAPHVVLSLTIADEHVAISPADLRALREAAAPLLAELASRRLTPNT